MSLLSIVINAQNPNVAEIRKKMAAIRQNTDWNNAEAAKKANEEIKLLSKQLMLGAASFNQTQNQGGQSEQDSSLNDGVDYRMHLWDQIWTSVHQGKEIDLAKPLREEIVEDYADDESPKVKNLLFFQEMKFLCIDMSMNGIEQIIDQMENYKSIEMLFITGGLNGAPVDLDDLFHRAKNYPLHTLYIINFKHHVHSIPNSIERFKDLETLILFNNQLEKLPDEIKSLTSLKNLFVDINPLSEILPAISTLTGIDSLGISQTLISDVEMKKIEKHLPNCKILNQ